jgi:hypothetical protein
LKYLEGQHLLQCLPHNTIPIRFSIQRPTDPGRFRGLPPPDLPDGSPMSARSPEPGVLGPHGLQMRGWGVRKAHKLAV